MLAWTSSSKSSSWASLCDALRRWYRREADDFKWTRRGHGFFAEGDSLEPEAENIAREDCEDDERNREKAAVTTSTE